MTRKLLFICSQNRLRSPTAEQVFADWPGVEVSSAGVNHDAENPAPRRRRDFSISTGSAGRDIRKRYLPTDSKPCKHDCRAPLSISKDS